MQTVLQPNKNGQFFQKDFATNVGGTNLVDSVFTITEEQAAYGSYNFDYVLTGGIRKRLGPVMINPTPDTQLNSLGLGILAPISGTSKSAFRAAGTALQYFNPGTPSFTALSSDAASASTTPFNASSTQPVVMTQFSTGTADILWAGGGGTTLPVGAYSTSKYTTNGVQTPTGTLTVTNHVSGAGSWNSGNFGIFYYTLVLRKKSTQAFSNAGYLAVLNTQPVDPFVTTTSTLTDSVGLSWSLSGVDTTLIDQIWIYRSAVGGVSGFTTGNLIAQLSSTATSFTDLGNLGNPDILLSTTVPRAGNTIVDNSPLPAATYTAMVQWSHRLVVASGNTVQISDVNKSESWPLTNPITIPSAGPITGLAKISFTSPQANSLQDLLVIFKERELWTLSGTAYTNWNLVQISNDGCPNQNLIVTAGAFLAWVDYRGVFLWNGTGKPLYASRLIQPLFDYGGDLDKSQYGIGCAAYFRRENQIIWFLSHKTYGTQKFAIKMDLRLTMLAINALVSGNQVDAVFALDTYAFPIYSATTYVPLNSANEQMVLGDNAGYCYYANNGYSDGGANYPFTYVTSDLHMGDPNTKKVFQKVIVWVQDLGNWNLELDYWADYRTGPAYQATQQLPISTENQQAAALWDLAYFDLAYWDNYQPTVRPIVFNLQGGTNNSTQGSALRLQFKNATANQPITIHGFSVLYSLAEGIT